MSLTIHIISCMDSLFVQFLRLTFFNDYLISVPHIQLSAKSDSQTVNFKHRFNHKVQGGVPMSCKEGHLLVDG